MYKAFGTFVDNYPKLKGVNPIFNKTNIVQEYPSDEDPINSLKLAASVHKEVRRFIQPYLRPGTKLVDIAKLIESKTQELSNQEKSINKGIGFPVGISLNECAAHYHPDSTENRTLTENDVVKIDFGTEVNGWIIDSAFTVCFDNKYDNLLAAVKEGTETGIKNIGVDVPIGEWGANIQEVIESFEVTLDGKTTPIKAVSNLGGHNITKGIIHGGIFLPCVDLRNHFMFSSKRFAEGIYAVETFGTTGINEMHEKGDCTLYRLNPSWKQYENNLKLASTKKLLQKIVNSFNTLPFSDRFIEVYNINNYKSQLNLLRNNNLINGYPPLCGNPGDFTAQYEHTVHVGDGNKIVFSRGEDY